MRTGLAISTIAHGGFIAWSVLVLVAKPFDRPPESFAVDTITADEFSKMTKGQKDATKKSDPKRLAEKITDTPKPIEDITQKVSDKKEIQPTNSEPPPPQAEAPKQEKPEKKVEKPPEPKIDPIAEALKKEEAKKPEKKAEAKPPQPKPSQNVKPQPKFDVNRIAALLDKRDPQRQATADVTENKDPNRGGNGNAPTLSQSALDALSARLRQCWNPPVGAVEADRVFVVLRVQFNRDGTVARPMEMIEGTPSAVGPAMVESAKRAVLQCQPFTMLRQENYDAWKDIELKFDPRDMFRG